MDNRDTVSIDPNRNQYYTQHTKIGLSLTSEVKNTSSNFTDYVTPAEQIFKLAKVSCQEALQFNSENTE